MDVLHSIAELKEWRSALTGSLGLVPTMGFLHEGHVSLIKESVQENDNTLVSIFVNPSQFNQKSDFTSYPRDMGRDLALAEEAGANAVFSPEAEEVYPPGFDTWIELDQMARRLEGEFRPGHFRGVATVVFLLFQLSKANRAYFGQKDAQQLLVIRRMVEDLHLDVSVVGMPTVREADGLAMSSRNARLTPEERTTAPALYKALQFAEDSIRSGSGDVTIIKQTMEEMITSAGDFRIDYVSIANPGSLEEKMSVSPPALVSLAAFLGDVRLIDNVLVE